MRALEVGRCMLSGAGMVPWCVGVAIESTLRGRAGSEAGLETGAWSRPFRNTIRLLEWGVSLSECARAQAGDRAA